MIHISIRNIGRNQFLVDSNQQITLTSNQANATRWRIARNFQSMAGVVTYTIQSTLSNRKIDLSNFSITNGTNVGTWSNNNSNNQRWFVTLPSESVLPPVTPPPITPPLYQAIHFWSMFQVAFHHHLNHHQL